METIWIVEEALDAEEFVEWAVVAVATDHHEARRLAEESAQGEFDSFSHMADNTQWNGAVTDSLQVLYSLMDSPPFPMVRVRLVKVNEFLPELQ
jgi:hypothetical protein